MRALPASLPRLAAPAVVLAALALGGCGGSDSPTSTGFAVQTANGPIDLNATRTTKVSGKPGRKIAATRTTPVTGRARRAPPPDLPRGGRTLLPRQRIVAFYGAPQAKELGELGIGSPDEAMGKLIKQAGDYKGKDRRPVLPAAELIVTIANAHPGPDGKYRTQQKFSVIDRYLKAARKRKALLILDIQPGRADFMDETRHLHKYLTYPDVGLALDPEWKMGPDEVPGKVIGHTDASKINEVSDYLARLVRAHRLPQKALIVHRFTDPMIRDEKAIKPRKELSMVESIDGFGGQEVKRDKYKAFTKKKNHLLPGFKLFYHEDTDLFTPSQVLKLSPHPQLVIYE